MHVYAYVHVRMHPHIWDEERVKEKDWCDSGMFCTLQVASWVGENFPSAPSKTTTKNLLAIKFPGTSICTLLHIPNWVRGGNEEGGFDAQRSFFVKPKKVSKSLACLSRNVPFCLDSPLNPHLTPLTLSLSQHTCKQSVIWFPSVSFLGGEFRILPLFWLLRESWMGST